MSPEGTRLHLTLLVGRILVALIFILSGFNKISGFSSTAGYMASKGLPMAEVLLVPTILVELGGGLAILLGWHARLAAWAIFLFLIPVTLMFHAFWAVDAAQYQSQFNHFMKNVALMGAMLYIAGAGPGRFSIGEREGRHEHPPAGAQRV